MHLFRQPVSLGIGHQTRALKSVAVPNGTMPKETTRSVRRCSGTSRTSIRPVCTRVRSLVASAALVPFGIELQKSLSRMLSLPMPNETTTTRWGPVWHGKSTRQHPLSPRVRRCARGSHSSGHRLVPQGIELVQTVRTVPNATSRLCGHVQELVQVARHCAGGSDSRAGGSDVGAGAATVMAAARLPHVPSYLPALQPSYLDLPAFLPL